MCEISLKQIIEYPHCRRNIMQGWHWREDGDESAKATESCTPLLSQGMCRLQDQEVEQVRHTLVLVMRCHQQVEN